MAEHTPKPWMVKSGEALTVVDGYGMRVAHITHIGLHGRRSADETSANARLIAAAPDMLAAMSAMHAVLWAGLSSDEQMFQDAADLIENAFLKATGETYEERRAYLMDTFKYPEPPQ